MQNISKTFVITCVFFVFSMTVLSQNVTILPSGITPTPNAKYAQLSYDAIVALPTPQRGDLAIDTTFNCLRIYNGSKWVCSYQKPANPTLNVAAITTVGGLNDGYGFGIATDTSGNVYVAGHFLGTALFGTTAKTAVGGFDVFVAKYNSSGVLQWVQTVGGANYDYAYGIATDVGGNVYITGYFSGTATFGTESKTAVGSDDIFVAKYNSGGGLQWVQTAGGTSSDSGKSIATDVGGNVYVTGFFAGTATFGNQSRTSVGDKDIFVAKYNDSGTLQWLRAAGGSGDDEGLSMATDVDGSVYVTGYFAGTATFGTESRTSAGYGDIFIAKYNNNGTLQWLRAAGGSGSDDGLSIAIDNISGNVHVSGYFEETATFGTESGTSAGGRDIFVVKYNSSGTLQWLQTVGNTSNDYAYGITTDVGGNVYITGYFYGTITIGNLSKTAVGSSDALVAKFNNSGNVQWMQTVGGTSAEESYSIAGDTKGNVYAVGFFFGTAIFGSRSKTVTGGRDIFVIRIQQ